jgi:hypothetical protein
MSIEIETAAVGCESEEALVARLRKMIREDSNILVGIVGLNSEGEVVTGWVSAGCRWRGEDAVETYKRAVEYVALMIKHDAPGIAEMMAQLSEIAEQQAAEKGH